MRILHVVDQISQQTGGGSAKVPYQLASFQARQGHRVTIFTSDYQAKEQAPPEGVVLRKFKCWLNFLDGVRITPSMLFADFRDFDIIHLHNYRTFVNIVAARAAAMYHIPYVLQAHGSCLPILTANPITKRIHRGLWQSSIFYNASRYIADAPLEMDQYIAEGAGRGDIDFIPVGLDLSEFANLPARNSRGQTVLYVGRLHHTKAIGSLIWEFAQLSRTDVRLVIAGPDYGAAKELRCLADDLGIADRVDFVGFVDGVERLRLYINADVFVMPSRYEMWGLAFMEALACGAPVMITEGCGAASFLPPACGMVVSSGAGKMAVAMDAMLGVDFGSQHRQYRQEWVKDYGWDRLAVRIERLYREALNGQ